MVIRLKDIYIGNTNGDDEANHSNFKELFYKDNEKYYEILNDNLKFIVSGQKGSGKTILGRYIQAEINSQENSICNIINKNLFTFQKLVEVGPIHLDTDEYTSFYKWVLYREISKCILCRDINPLERKEKPLLKRIADTLRYKSSLHNLKAFFDVRYQKGNYKYDSYTTEDQLYGSGNIEGIFNSYKASLNALKKKVKKYDSKKYYECLLEVQNWILTCLSFVNVIIILDDLDELELKLDDSNDSVRFLLRLIEAVNEINILFSEHNIKGSKCIILMRTDILQEINKHSSNLSKIREDKEVNLYWIDKNYNYPHEHVLMEMILNKIKVSCSSLSGLSNEELYKTLFPEKVDNKDMVRYIIDYSFGRPRDFIRYLQIVMREFPNETKITSRMLAHCKKDYSDKFCSELYNELYIHLDNEYVDQLLGLLKDLRKKSFNYSNIEKFYIEHREDYPKITSIKSAIESLYKYSIIGNTWKKGDQLRFSWAYRRDGDKNIDLSKRFTVHFALRRYLFLE